MNEYWQPKPIDPPQPDPEMKNLSGIQRAVEVVRYTILSIEWWLSPNGKLREWLRLNGKVSSVLLIPAILVVPLVTFIVWQIEKWIGWLVSIASNLVLFPIIAVGVILLLRIILGR